MASAMAERRKESRERERDRDDEARHRVNKSLTGARAIALGV